MTAVLNSKGPSAARRATSLALAALLLAVPATVMAHDIPADITVQAFVKPDGQTLHLLVRVPLGALIDVEFPRRGPGYLDFDRAEPLLRVAAGQWIADFCRLYEDDRDLGRPAVVAARISLPSDRSFVDYETARANLTGKPPLSNEADMVWSEGRLDVLYDYPIRSDRSDFSIETGLERRGLKVTTVLRFLPPGGVVRAFEFLGDPGVIRLDPRWYQAALRFVHLGFLHILDGVDHLLFLFCLVIPFRRLGPLVVVVTAFTVAHSITLISSAFGLTPAALWFPPLIETLIATSIVYMALENIVSARLERRWLIAFGFGLVHGFGFSFALRQTLQFAGAHLMTSLLSFNLGVELGQVFVLLLMIPALNVVFRFVVAERMGTIVLSALVAHTGWHWLIERGTRLRQFPFRWPDFSLALLASLNRWLILAVIVSGIAWLLFRVVRRTIERAIEDKATLGADE